MLLEKLPLRIFVDLSVFRRHGNMKKSSLAPPPFFFFCFIKGKLRHRLLSLTNTRDAQVYKNSTFSL